jgi:hypothetical protein
VDQLCGSVRRPGQVGHIVSALEELDTGYSAANDGTANRYDPQDAFPPLQLHACYGIFSSEKLENSFDRAYTGHEVQPEAQDKAKHPQAHKDRSRGST